MRDFIDRYADANEVPLILADGFDGAILGIANTIGHSESVAYDYNQCVRILMARDDMDEEDAAKYMDFNVVTAYMGDHTPTFITRPNSKYSSIESDERIKRLMAQVGYPDSQSLYTAFKQLENELWQKGVGL
jgi:hypothetical protein